MLPVRNNNGRTLLRCHRLGVDPALRRASRTVTTTRITVTLMHRDTKLGLALAILVMGFAAALCFPRETHESGLDLRLQTADELDSVIRLKQVKTYTDADRPKPRGSEAPANEEVLPAVALQNGPPLAGVPDPIRQPREIEPTPIEPDNPLADVMPPPEAEPVVHTRTYRVRYNDTLSGIAKQELGDHTKWIELYNANRKLLRDPNGLAPGMVLVIPIPSGDDVSPAPTGPASLPIVISPQPVVLESPARVEPTRPETATARPSGRFSRPTRISSGNAAPKAN